MRSKRRPLGCKLKIDTPPRWREQSSPIVVDQDRESDYATRQPVHVARRCAPHRRDHPPAFFSMRASRVVLHKRTPFTRDEREGLAEGLSGVNHIDMLEIQIDDALRYVASIAGRDGKVDEDNYPVRRGTVMKLDDHSALLWVHGATTAVNARLKYFQGKRPSRRPCAYAAMRGEEGDGG